MIFALFCLICVTHVATAAACTYTTSLLVTGSVASPVTDGASVTWTPVTQSAVADVLAKHSYECYSSSTTCKNDCIIVPDCKRISCLLPTAPAGTVWSDTAKCQDGKFFADGTTCSLTFTSTTQDLGYFTGDVFTAKSSYTCTKGVASPVIIAKHDKLCKATTPAGSTACTAGAGPCTTTCATGKKAFTPEYKCVQGKWVGDLECKTEKCILAIFGAKTCPDKSAAGDECTGIAPTTANTALFNCAAAKTTCIAATQTTDAAWAPVDCNVRKACKVGTDPTGLIASEAGAAGCTLNDIVAVGSSCAYKVIDTTAHTFGGYATTTNPCTGDETRAATKKAGGSGTYTCLSTGWSTDKPYKVTNLEGKTCAIGTIGADKRWKKSATGCVSPIASGAACAIETSDAAKYESCDASLSCTNGAFTKSEDSHYGCKIKAIAGKTCANPTAVSGRTITAACETNTESGSSCFYWSNTDKTCNGLNSITCTNGAWGTAPSACTDTPVAQDTVDSYLWYGGRENFNTLQNGITNSADYAGVVNRALGNTKYASTGTSNTVTATAPVNTAVDPKTAGWTITDAQTSQLGKKRADGTACETKNWQNVAVEKWADVSTADKSFYTDYKVNKFTYVKVAVVTSEKDTIVGAMGSVVSGLDAASQATCSHKKAVLIQAGDIATSSSSMVSASRYLMAIVAVVALFL